MFCCAFGKSTWEIIQNNPDFNWDWYEIKYNTMEYGKKKYILEHIIIIAKPILEKLFVDNNIIEYILQLL